MDSKVGRNWELKHERHSRKGSFGRSKNLSGGNFGKGKKIRRRRQLRRRIASEREGAPI